MAEQARINLRWAQALIGGLTAAGLTEVVISPGSRSTPLALACARQPGLRLHVQIDERCAAFFALGLARGSVRPVALIATSGSAPAHWLPAVIEADHSGVPLLLLSADRPPELQDCGANQTTRQADLFRAHARAVHLPPPPAGLAGERRQARQLGRRALQESRWPRPGPVHLNLPFREPLVPDGEFVAETASGSGELAPLPSLLPDAEQVRRLAARFAGRRGLIVAGPESGSGTVTHGPALLRLARALDAPLLADPLSGLRFGLPEARPWLSAGYDVRLQEQTFIETQRPEWVLRTGAMPVSKALGQALAEWNEAYTVLLDARGRWRDPLYQVDEMVIADTAAFAEALADAVHRPAPAQWLRAFADAEEAAPPAAAPREAQLVRALLAALPAGGTLFSGNSLPIRWLDRFSGCSGKPLRLLANRGVSGIDGNISTLAGLATADPGSTTAGLLGDLACYHDMNGLLALRGLDVLIILVDNHGGGIFRQLPQAALPEFERLWRTDPELDFSRAAALYDLDCERVAASEPPAPKLQAMLARSGARLLIIEMDG